MLYRFVDYRCFILRFCVRWFFICHLPATVGFCSYRTGKERLGPRFWRQLDTVAGLRTLRAYCGAWRAVPGSVLRLTSSACTQRNYHLLLLPRCFDTDSVQFYRFSPLPVYSPLLDFSCTRALPLLVVSVLFCWVLSGILH